MLMPFGWIFGRVMELRNALYDRGLLKSHLLGARTISIGNITTGGTGKTPLVALVGEILADSGEKVCVLTRGYGREKQRARVLVSDGENVLVDAKTGGDEPVELARRLLGKAVVVADADRVGAAKWAKEKFEVTAFVLDDAFQHRRAKRDLDIVCIDATNPFGGGRVLPAGRLREPLQNLKRADAIVITRADQVENIQDLRSETAKLELTAQIFESHNKLVSAESVEEFHAKAQSSQRRRSEGIGLGRVFAFCGLGNPQNFFDLLTRNSISLAGTRHFSDHHNYTSGDVTSIESAAQNAGASSLVTTAKDAVKLSDLKFEMPCYVVEIETVIEAAEAFRRLVISS